MSQENLEIVRRNNDACDQQDLGAYLDTVADTVTFRSRFSVMDHRVYRGRDDVGRYFAELDEVLVALQCAARAAGRGRAPCGGPVPPPRGRSGEQSPVGGAPPASVFTLDGGKVVPDRCLRGPGGGPGKPSGCRTHQQPPALWSPDALLGHRYLRGRGAVVRYRVIPSPYARPETEGTRRLCQTTAGAATTPSERLQTARERRDRFSDQYDAEHAGRGRGAAHIDQSCRQPSTSSPPREAWLAWVDRTTSR